MSKNLTENKINTTIAAADVTLINTSITTIASKIPVGTLSDDQRTVYKSMDVANKIFVEDVLNELNLSGTGVVPSFINPASLQNDLTLFNQLENVEIALQNLLQRVADAKRIVSNEALNTAYASYDAYASASKAGVLNAKQAYDKLKIRFEAQGKSGTPKDSKP